MEGVGGSAGFADRTAYCIGLRSHRMANEVYVGKDLGGKPLSPPPSSFSSTSRGSGIDILVYGRRLLRGASRPCPDLQRHEQSFDVSLQYFGGVMNYHMEKTVG